MIFLLDCTIKVSVILLIAVCSLRLLRNQSAAFRHAVLSAALFCSAVTPFLSLAMRSSGLAPITPLAMLTAPTLNPVRAVSPVASGEPFDEATLTPVDLSPPQWLPPTFWLVGVALGLIILLMGLTRLVRLTRASQPMVSEDWRSQAVRIASDYGIRRPVGLLQSQNPSILVTWGLLRPKVILPASALEWSLERSDIVLRHELAHIRRGDWFVQMTAQVLRIIYWFNPLLWIVCRRMRLESEFACDDAVLSQGVAGTEYAHHLLELARAFNKPDRAWSAAMAIAGPSNVERRFTAMLNPAINRRATSRFTAAATALAALLITLSLAAVSAYPQAAVISNPPAVVAERQVDPAVAEYVNRVGQNIIRNSEAKVPFTIKVIQSDEAKTVSLPGGFFYVNSGLILAAEGAQQEAGEVAKALAEQEAVRRELEKEIESRSIQDQRKQEELRREFEAAARAEVLLRRQLETLASQESAIQRESALENLKRELEAKTLERTLVTEAEMRRMQEEVRRAQQEVTRATEAADPALSELRNSQNDVRRALVELRQMLEEMRSMIEDIRRSPKDGQGKQ